MISDEKRAENRRVFRARHEARKYTRLNASEMDLMKCYDCGERPHIKLTDYKEDTAQRCVMLACGCKGKFKWFQLVE